MSKNVNYEFKILYAVGVLLVVAGHFNSPVLTFGNLFPYDAYHMPLFMVASGYFYKSANNGSLASVSRYVKRKTIRLLLPYFLWNVLYGLLAQLLHNNPIYSFRIGEEIEFNWTALFLYPWGYAQGFEFNVASWFVMSLYLAEVANVLMRYFLHKLRIEKECVVLACGFLLAVLGVERAQMGNLQPLMVGMTRMGYLLFWYQFGRFYKIYLQKWDEKIPFAAAVLANLMLSLLIVAAFGNDCPSVYLSYYPVSTKVVLIRAALGIWWWLRISRAITPLLKNSKIILFLADHTFSYMMHQGLAGVLLNYVLLKLHWPDFDENIYYSAIWYGAGTEELRIVYVVAIPAAISLVLYLYERWVRPPFKVCVQKLKSEKAKKAF